MSNTFLTRMPAGIAGNVTRLEHATIEPGLFNASYPCLSFGIFAKVVSGLYRPVASGDTIANLVGGFVARPFPVNEPYGTTIAQEAIGQGVPNLADAANILKRGYMMVVVTSNGGTTNTEIAKGDKVYIRKTAGAGAGAGLAGAVGDIEAGASTGAEILPNCFFMGASDSNGFTEIAFNI